MQPEHGEVYRSGAGRGDLRPGAAAVGGFFDEVLRGIGGVVVPGETDLHRGDSDGRQHGRGNRHRRRWRDLTIGDQCRGGADIDKSIGHERHGELVDISQNIPAGVLRGVVEFL